MSGWKFGVGVFVLDVGFGTSARAQEGVPGGWAPQFGYQTFGTPEVGGGFSFGDATPGYGMAGYGAGVTPFGYRGINPYGRALYGSNAPGVNYGFASPSGRTVNAVDPLIDSIRQTTRRRCVR